MKKIYIGLICLFSVLFIQAQQTTSIPDPNFEKQLIDFGYDTGTPDGVVFTDNIKNITHLSVYNNISDLTGIQDFSSLVIFYCSNNSIKNLDLSKCLKLTWINCNNNQISKITLPDSIQHIELEYNNLSQIDLSKNDRLNYLDLMNNSLQNIDIANNINLKTLNLGHNKITSIDISKNTLLTELCCYNNEISNLDISKNTELTLIRCGSNNIKNLNASQCSKLTWIDCFNNQLNTLVLPDSIEKVEAGFNNINIIDISKKIRLVRLNLDFNSLSSIDIANNINLQELYIGNNQFTNINVSKNIHLQRLECVNNQISNIDVSNNPELIFFHCFFNKIKNLDLSHNSKLQGLDCSTNNLSLLNIRNNNNMILSGNSNFSHNPNLYCIVVDDPFYSTKNWENAKDTNAVYTSRPCGSNIIAGNVYDDINLNCKLDSVDKKLSAYLVKLSGKYDSFSYTDSNGYFEFKVDSNANYNISLYKPQTFSIISNFCNKDEFSINSGVGGKNSYQNDFGLHFNDCSALSVEISKSIMRKCFKTSTSVLYKNEGPKNALKAEIYIDYPDYIDIVSASKKYSTVDSANKIYKFTIDTVKSFSTSIIQISDSVQCGSPILPHYTQCIKTWITPKSDCSQLKNNTVWDESDIKTNQIPKNIGDSVVEFTIKNYGTGNMSTPEKFRLYYNNELADTGMFQLKSNDSLKICSRADGSTIRLEADQCKNHPGQSLPRATIEGCGNPAKVGYWPNSQCDDLDPDISEICLDVSQSHDPNEKTVSPSGLTSNNYVPEKAPLHYSISFQNTGNDTAFTVLIVDTLSQNLDLGTLKITGSSHKYTYSLTGQGSPVLEFTFKNINLPDSTTDLTHSQGFISYTINPKDSIIKGTKIDNFADIYFDYNSPVRTNTTHVVALDTTIISNKLITVKLISTPTKSNEVEIPNIIIYPNPFSESIEIKGNTTDFNVFKIYDNKGLLILTKSISTFDKIDLSNLSQGIYFLNISNTKGNSFKYEIIKN